MSYILTGGFARGYRTYILAGVGAVVAIANWAVGDMSTQQALQTVWELAISISIGAARASIPSN
jgi:hypothetical protein